MHHWQLAQPLVERLQQVQLQENSKQLQMQALGQQVLTPMQLTQVRLQLQRQMPARQQRLLRWQGQQHQREELE